MANIMTVDQHAAAAHFVKARNQTRERGFARPRFSYQRDASSSRHVQVDAREHLAALSAIARVVAKRHVVHTNASAPHRERLAQRMIVDLWFQIENGKDS